MVKKCIVCGSEFEAKAGGEKYCSEECRNAEIPVHKHIGEIHGELEIISIYQKRSVLFANCKCSCGRGCTVRYCNLSSGRTKTCGRDHPHVGRQKLEGKTNQYGVRVLYEAGMTGKHKLFHCSCSCGSEFDVSENSFPIVQSCGCVRKTSHQEGTDIYQILNRKISKNNTSGVKGVTWNSESGKWIAHIGFKGVRYYLGRYEEIADAAEARSQAEENLYGDFFAWYAEEHPKQWGILSGRKGRCAADSGEMQKIGV